MLYLIIGVTTASTTDFKSLCDTTSTTLKVVVPPEDVRESGLLKDRVIIHFPDIVGADMTMFKEAVANWKKYERWQSVLDHKEIKKPVRPVLVIQVEDGNEREITQTDLDSCISILEDAIRRELQAGEVFIRLINTRPLKGMGWIYAGWMLTLKKMKRAIVVFFKMNLSTGWDPQCRNNDVFRHANDYTYRSIARTYDYVPRLPVVWSLMPN